MASWQRKKISKGQTIADKFKKARLEQDFSLDDICQATKIQVKYLELLENGDYQNLPGEVYIRIWIKIYAKFLNLSSAELLSDYQQEKIIRTKINKQPTTKQKIVLKNSFKKYLGNFLKPHFLKRASIISLFIIFLAYLSWEINNIISPPFVEIFEPINNIKTTNSSIDIVGQTESEVQLMINNELVLLDEQGNFIKKINLSPNLNKLQISAKKKHSRTKLIEFNILRIEAE